jgi:hypothetical protein
MRSLNTVTDNDGLSPDVVEPIAVIGLATRFPQEATSTQALWELLLHARSTWSTIPKERFNADAFFHPDPEHGGTVGPTPNIPSIYYYHANHSTLGN